MLCNGRCIMILRSCSYGSISCIAMDEMTTAYTTGPLMLGVAALIAAIIIAAAAVWGGRTWLLTAGIPPIPPLQVDAYDRAQMMPPYQPPLI